MDINMRRGNDLTVKLTVIDDTTNAAMDLTKFTSKVITMYVRKNPNDEDEDAVITVEGTITNAANGAVSFDITPSMTLTSQLKDNVKYTTDFIAILNTKKYNVLRTIFCLISD